MPDSNYTCPKCQGEMQQGFMLDNNQGIGQAKWTPGRPQKSWLTGLKPPEQPIPVGTYRCEVCGFLESYASDEYGPE